MEDEQRNKAHKNKTVGNKAAKKDELRKRRAGIDLQPNRGSNVRAFLGPSAGSHKSQKFFRSVEKRETALHVPTEDKTLRHIVAEPPLLVAVVGPPGVGKTTLIKSMVKFYSSRSLQSVRGPITVVAGRSRRITFLEVPNSLAAMCDVAKVADLVLLMVDGSYGFEMETFEFLNIAQVHGFPKVFGIVSHLDQLKTGKALKKRKKFLRHRFWHEVAAGAKLICLSPMVRGMYRPTDVLNLHRLLICVEPKTQSWRNTHSCVLVDRQEDITDPALVAQNPNVSRTVAFYGYARGRPMKEHQLVHIPGLGDYPVSHLSHTPDPCQGDSLGGGNSQGHRMRHLSLKQKRLYAPYCDVGGISYDDDAIYIQEDAEMGAIERSGEGLQLLRELQRAKPMNAARTRLQVVGQDGTGDAQDAGTRRQRRPVVFRDEDTMELEMGEVTIPSDDDDDDDSSSSSSSNGNGGSEGIIHAGAVADRAGGARARAAPQLADFGMPEESGDAEAEDGVAEATGLAPRLRNDADAIRINTVAHAWGSDTRLLRLLKNLCVTGDWSAGAGGTDDAEGSDSAEVESKGYESDDADFEAEARGEKPMTRDAGSSDGTESLGDSNEEDREEEEDEDSGGMSAAKVRAVMEDMSSSARAAAGRGANALAGVSYGDARLRSITAAAGRGVGNGVDDDDDDGTRGWRRAGTVNKAAKLDRAVGGGSSTRSNAGGQDGYDILAEDDQQDGAGLVSADEELNNLVAKFLNADAAPGAGGSSSNGSRRAAAATADDDDGIKFYDAKEHLRSSHTAGPAGRGAAGRGDDGDDDDDGAGPNSAPLTAAQERILKKKMDKKRAFDENYDSGEIGGEGKNKTYSYYNQLNRKVEEKKEKLDEALNDVGDDIERKIQLVGYFSGLYVRFVIEDLPVEFVRLHDPCQPLLAGGVNSGEDEFRVVHARLKRHRWYPKILKAQDPVLLSIGWRRIQTQPIFATEDPNGRNRYLKYTPLHMHCLAAFYAPVTPPNTGFLAIPVREQRTSNFRISCTGYTVGNDVSASVVKKLKLTGTPAKVEKTTVFIKDMFTSDVEAAKFVGAKVKAVSGIRGIIKSVMKGKNGLVRATFEDKIFLSDIVFIRSWKAVEPPAYCSIQRNLLDPNWTGMRTMRELRWDYNVPIPENKDSEYREIKRRQRVGADDDAEGGEAADANRSVLLSRNTRMQLPFDMKETFIPLKRTSELQARLQGAATLAPEAREQRRQALLDTFEDRADAMTKKKDEAKKRARERALQAAEKDQEVYAQGLKKAKKETARRDEFRSQHKSRK